jgi:hypothetical protein
LAVKGAQKDDRTTRASDIGILVLSLIAYIVFSFAACFVFALFIHDYLVACALSFTSVGFVSYLGMHFVLPIEMSRFDARVLHEFAKRKLIDFQFVEEDRDSLD